MYLAMNRFKVKRGEEERFIEVWKNRESHLHEMPGFISFHLMRGSQTEEYTLFASHAQWESKAAFDGWVHSEAFQKTHAKAGGASTGIYLERPQLECFESVL